jgi:hypothetical protein
MSVTYNSKWSITVGSALTANATHALHLSLSSSGGNLGGNYAHTVTAMGTVLYTGTANRSYRVSSYRPGVSGWALISSAALDVYGSTTDAASMNTFLNNMLTGDLLVMTTYDEPQNNTSYFSANLTNNFGATLNGSIGYRYCYVLVASKGKGVIYEHYGLDTEYRAVTLSIGRAP